jgi:hypothetical protein
VPACLFGAPAIGFCLWQSGLSRDSTQAHWGVTAAITFAAVAAGVMGHRRQQVASVAWLRNELPGRHHWYRWSTPERVSVLVWSALIVAIAGWDLYSFIAQSHGLPTLSYYFGRITRFQVGRGLAVALWLIVGAYLCAGGRTRVEQ